MSDLQWKIEDGRLWVERTGEGYRAWWDQATSDEAATIERQASDLSRMREALKKIATVEGESDLAILWPWARDIARAALPPATDDTHVEPSNVDRGDLYGRLNKRKSP